MNNLTMSDPVLALALQHLAHARDALISASSMSTDADFWNEGGEGFKAVTEIKQFIADVGHTF